MHQREREREWLTINVFYTWVGREWIRHLDTSKLNILGETEKAQLSWTSENRIVCFGHLANEYNRYLELWEVLCAICHFHFWRCSLVFFDYAIHVCSARLYMVHSLQTPNICRLNMKYTSRMVNRKNCIFQWWYNAQHPIESNNNNLARGIGWIWEPLSYILCTHCYNRRKYTIEFNVISSRTHFVSNNDAYAVTYECICMYR